MFSMILILGAILGLSACNNGPSELPTTAYEKVKFAFNGVERSFADKVRTQARRSRMRKRSLSY